VIPGLTVELTQRIRRLHGWAIVNALDANGRALHEANPIRRRRRWRGRIYSDRD